MNYAEDKRIQNTMDRLRGGDYRAIVAGMALLESAFEIAVADIGKIVESGFKRPHPCVVLLAKCQSIL